MDCRVEGDIGIIGITNYAQEQLGDVVSSLNCRKSVKQNDQRR